MLNFKKTFIFILTLALLGNGFTQNLNDYELALKLYAQEKYEEAIALFDESIQDNPKFTQSHYHRGLAYLKMKVFSKAISDINQAFQIDPNYEEAFYKLRDIAGQSRLN